MKAIIFIICVFTAAKIPSKKVTRDIIMNMQHTTTLDMITKKRDTTTNMTDMNTQQKNPDRKDTVMKSYSHKNKLPEPTLK